MEITNNYILMCEYAEEIQKVRKGKLERGDFHLVEDTGEIEIWDGDSLDKPNYTFIWLPRIDQILELFGNADKGETAGSRRTIEFLENSYHIPNKHNTYPTIEEHVISKYMFHFFKKVWVEEFDRKPVKGECRLRWVPEVKVKSKKLEIDLEKMNEYDYRTVTTYKENGEPAGIKTERIKYNFDTGQIEVVPEEEPKKKK